MSSITSPDAGSSSKSAPYLTGCLVLKPTSLSSVVVSNARKSVSVKVGGGVDGSEMKTDSFTFNSKLFTSSDEFASGAYSSLVQPLVKKTCAGENITAVIGGPGSLNFSNHLLSSANSRGVLAQAANQMLNSIMVNGKREGTVTFSWYKLGCTGTNTVDDVLRSASEVGVQSGEKAKELHVKELEKGRGVAVPGLWEVELSTSSDVDAVITHVQRISPQAKHDNGSAHSIIQLTVTSEHIRNSLQSFNATNTYADLKGVGKISFLVLGNLKKAGFIGPEWDKQPFNPWVDNVLTTIQWIEAQELGVDKTGPPPPTPTCYTSMALKDVLRGRQASMMLMMLTPTEQQVSETRQWLLLAEAIENTRSRYVSSGLATSPVPNNASRFSSPYPMPGSSSGSDSQGKSRPVVSSGIKPRPMTPSRFNGMNQPHSLLPPGAPTPGSVKRMGGAGAGEEKATTNASSSIKSPAAHHEFVEGSTGYNVLNTAKDEIRALTEALRVKTEMLDEAQGAYDMIVQQLHEDGSTLKKKDRERYKQVLAELKDYEIYKNVMESALTKMQKEMEGLLSENQSLKAKLSHKESDIKRREMFRDQYTRDLTNTRKQLTESEDKTEELEEKNKKLMKTGEELRTNFNAMRNDRNAMKKELELQVTQVQGLKEKVAALEGRDVVRCKEEEKTKAAHRAALESMYSHQEENDLLKSALSELLEEAANNGSSLAGKSSPSGGRANSPAGSGGSASKKRSGYRGSVVFMSQSDAGQQQEQSTGPGASSSASTLLPVAEKGKAVPPPPSTSKTRASAAKSRKDSILC